MSAPSDSDWLATFSRRAAGWELETTGETAESYDEMDLKLGVLGGILNYSFRRNRLDPPDPMLKHTAIPIIQGRDMVVETGVFSPCPRAFLVPMLQIIDITPKARLQAIVLSGTRELSDCIRRVLAELGGFMNTRCLRTVMGTKEDALKLHEEGFHFLVGTPPRVLHVLQMVPYARQTVKVIFLDDVAGIVNRQLGDQIVEVHKILPSDVQTLFVSNFVHKNHIQEVSALAQQLTRDPIRVIAKQRHVPDLERVDHFYLPLDQEDWRLDSLFDLLEVVGNSQVVIYCESQEKAQWLQHRLVEKGITALAANLEATAESEQEDPLSSFRTGYTRALVTTTFDRSRLTTDITDLERLPLLGYDPPLGPNEYLQRIGIRGALDRQGVVISLTTYEQLLILRKFESHFNIVIDEVPMNLE